MKGRGREREREKGEGEGEGEERGRGRGRYRERGTEGERRVQEWRGGGTQLRHHLSAKKQMANAEHEKAQENLRLAAADKHPAAIHELGIL